MLEKTELSISIPTTYQLELAPDSKKGLLILHGFSDHAVSVRKRLLGTGPFNDATVLSPNALFPAPAKKGDEYREAYSWYFRDPKTGFQMTTPEFAADVLMKLIRKLGLEKLPWVVVGFSQGGFFAPHLVRAGLNVKTIIAVGAAFRPEAYEGLSPFQLHAIHGEKDEIVTHEISRTSFEALQKKGIGTRYHSFPSLGHALHDEGRALLRTLLNDEAWSDAP